MFGKNLRDKTGKLNQGEVGRIVNIMLSFEVHSVAFRGHNVL